MKVRATRTGYYDLGKRHEGVEFEIKNPKDFSKKWMIALDGQEPKEEKQKAKQKSKVAESISDAEVI